MVVVIFCIFVQLDGEVSAPGLETTEPTQLEGELARQGIPILQIIDVRTSAVPPLPKLRQSIQLPFPKDTRIFVVDGNHLAFDAAFSMRLQPDGSTRRIDGFAQGRMVVIGVPRSQGRRYDDVLRHELVHAYLNVVAPGRESPAWLEEGLACYFSESPSHLSHETYRRYERDMKYLFAKHGDRMPGFLADAIFSSDPSQQLFMHFRIPNAVHLHIMRLSWENAFWMALVLIPFLSALFGRFLSELVYPWYVGWRRRYLSWRYSQALARLDRSLRQHVPASGFAFVANARKAVLLAEKTHGSADHVRRWSQDLQEQLWSAANGLVRQTGPCIPCFGVGGLLLAKSLDQLRSLPSAVDELMALDLSEEETIAATHERFNRIEQSLQVVSGLARWASFGPWPAAAQQYMEAAGRSRRSRRGLEKTVMHMLRDGRELQDQILKLAEQKIDPATWRHPLGDYSAAVRDILLAWKEHGATFRQVVESLREAEKELLDSLKEWSRDLWLDRLVTFKPRLASFLSAYAEPETSRRAVVRELVRSWGHADFVPRVRRDGFARWLHPPDALETVCFSICFAAFAGNWSSLRRSCAFFLLGLDRLLGG